MDGEAQVRRLRSFLLGGLVGASAALSVARRRRRRRERRPAGLAAFEGAPCYQETLEERERRV
jgi:cob(I)alamin adenosyltransferase